MSIPPVSEASIPPVRLGFWRTRYTMFVGFYYCYVFMQLDRQLVPLLMPAISSALGMSAKQIGTMYMFFGFSYALSTLYGGLLASKIGPKRIIALSIGAFSIALWWTGAVTSYMSFLYRYIIFGLAEGMEAGGAGQLLGRWFPRWERAKATALWSTTWVLTPAWLPLLAIPVYNAVGWRWTFALAGLFGLLGLVICKLLIFDRPEDFRWRGKSIPRIEIEETYQEEILDLQKAGKKDVTYEDAAALKPASVFSPFKNYKLWIMAIATFFHNNVFWGLAMWLPLFLTKNLGLSMTSMGGSMVVYNGLGFLGQLTAGYLADYLGHRKWFVVGSNACAVVTLVFLSKFAETASIPVLYLMLGITGFTLQWCWATLGAWTAETVGPELAGSGIGLLNFCGQMGTAVSGQVTGLLVITVAGVQKFNDVMLYWSGCALVAAILYSLVKEQVRLKKGKLVVE